MFYGKGASSETMSGNSCFIFFDKFGGVVVYRNPCLTKAWLIFLCWPAGGEGVFVFGGRSSIRNGSASATRNET